MDNDAAAVNPGNGTSRRSALKIGLGAGVGVAAWSGATITSLGGTPAYASGCTFIIKLDLSGGCRNTDQASGAEFGYHELKSTGLPTGYSLTTNISEGTACNAPLAQRTPVLTFPAGITCKVTVRFALPPDCTGTEVFEYVAGTGISPLAFPLTCTTLPATGPNKFPSQTQYTIVAKCNTTGASVICLN